MNIRTACNRLTALYSRQMPEAYTPAEVVAMLRVSDATLRRMARAYEKVYGELPTDMRQARVYSDEVLKRMEAAREVVEQGKAASFDKALELLAGSDATPDDLLAHMATPKPLERLLGEFQGIRQALDRQNALLEEQGVRLAALERENRALREQLQALPAPELPSRPWWRVWR